MTGNRYAIYYAPRTEEAISGTANAWLGYNPETGQRRQQPRVPGVTQGRLAELTADPATYGFHGTLKAPIVLADDVSERDFLDFVGRFAVTRRPFVVPSMGLVELGTFLALVPASRCEELHDLADTCVLEFDEFRRPAGVEELARRRASGLTARQDELLVRWGYPYVMEQWRFHLTLTGRVTDPAERTAIKAAVRSHFAACLDQPLPVRDLCVFRQAPGGRFTVLARFKLGGGRLVSSQVWRAS